MKTLKDLSDFDRQSLADFVKGELMKKDNLSTTNRAVDCWIVGIETFLSSKGLRMELVVDQAQRDLLDKDELTILDRRNSWGTKRKVGPV